MIKKIILRNFRCHTNLSLEFNQNFTYISGENGSGKTSILEAICYVSTTKSHRTSNHLDVIKHSSDFALITVETDDKKYKVVLSNKGKSFQINSQTIKKLSDLVGNLKTVMFSPDDLELIKGPPSTRRNLLNLEISKIDKDYLINLKKYTKILKERNLLLKEMRSQQQRPLLKVLSEQLYETGIILIAKRKKYIEKLTKHTNDIYKKFTTNDLKISYEINLEKEALLNYLLNKQNEDILYKNTLKGPHRDDIKILFNNKDSKLSSQGEIRLIVVAIKFAILKVMKDTTQDDVILLLDDILSEFDNKMQQKILNELPKDIQIILNSTNEITNEDIQIIKLKGEKNE